MIITCQRKGEGLDPVTELGLISYWQWGTLSGNNPVSDSKGNYDFNRVSMSSVSITYVINQKSEANGATYIDVNSPVSDRYSWAADVPISMIQNNFTVCGWFKVAGVSSEKHYILSYAIPDQLYDNNTQLNKICFSSSAFNYSGYSNYLDVAYNGNNQRTVANSMGTGWTFIAISRNGNTIYLRTNNNNSAVSATSMNTPSGAKLLIGTAYNSTNHCDLTIADMRFYNRFKTYDELTSIKNL